MTLTIAMKLEVTGTSEEQADVDRFNAQIEADGLNAPETVADLDESLWMDYLGLLRDLRQLVQRARARQHRKGS